MMEVVDLVEDILSDEYEEGEILDEDILYENVSSLEEFSDPDEKKVGSKGRNDVKKLKHRRKKEHKCKDDSVCRKERSGKHCYARIRSSLDSKSKNCSAKGVSLDFDKKPRPAVAKQISPTRGSAKKDSSNRETTKGNRKPDDRGRYPPYYFQHDNRDRANPLRRNASDRRPARTRRFSADDRRENDRKRKSPSPRPVVKHLHETNRVVAKTSLLDRLVGSGSIPQKSGVSCESDDCSAKIEHPTDAEQQVVTQSEVTLLLNHETEGPKTVTTLDNNEEPTLESTVVVNTDICDAVGQKDDAIHQTHNLCPEDIPVPPTPKATSPVPEPPKEEIDELHLRLFALKTAIMKKQNDFKRKKRLAASKKSCVPGNDSFTEFALMGLGEDECESIPTPPPPGTDSWPAPTIRDLDDPRWSDEDMVIDQESNYGDTIIEANIPASDPSLQTYVRHSVSASSQSSQDKLPCCKGNPIPVVSQHRPAKEIEERRPGLSSSTSVIVPVQEIKAPVVKKETPKYLKEINSNRNAGLRRRAPRRPRRRRNSLRQRTPAFRRVERSIHHRDSISKRSRVFEGDDDEDALRQLALMSVKPKSTITGGMLAKVGDNLNPLHIETDPVALESKSESPAKNASPAETWEDIDEDILRAQLLSSLTRNIPVAPSQPALPPSQAVSGKRVVIEHNMSLRKDVLTKRLNKENLYTKRNVIVHPNSMKSSKRNSKKYVNPNVKPSLTPPLNAPIIEKFIIKVSESDSSDDEEKTIRGKIVSDFESAVCQKLDIESSIDKLLEEARKETELIQKATQYYPMYDVGPETMAVLKEETTSSATHDTATNQKVKSEIASPVEQSPTSPLDIAIETTSIAMYDAAVQKVKSEFPPPVEQSLASPMEVANETTSLATFDTTYQKLKSELPSPVEQSLNSPSEVADVGFVASPVNEDEGSQESSQGTSHLPAWQQEEFKRQKRIMAQKESVIAAAKEKIIAKKKLAAGSASEELSKKCSFKPSSTSEKSASSVGIMENKTDCMIPSADTNLVTADFPEETSDGCDLKAVDISSVNTCVTVLEPQGGCRITSDSEDHCLQSEVRTCIDFMLSNICSTEMDTGLSGRSQTSEFTPDSTAITSNGSSKSIADSSGDTKMSIEVPREINTSNSILSNSKITDGKISLVVSPAMSSADPKLLVCHPSVTTAPVNVPSSTQAPSSKQLKQLLQNKISELYKKVVSSKNIPRTVASPGKVVVLKKSPARGTVNATIQKITQLPINQPNKQLVGSLSYGVALSAVKKSLFAVKDSSYALKGLNEMTDMVAGLENGMSEYRNLRKEFIAQRKQLMLIQQKVSKKRQQLLEMKDTIENKKRMLQSTISMDTSSLSPLPDTRDQPKQSSRASELLTLKFKEVCLKAQFAMMGLETASRPQAAVKMSRPAEDLNLSPRKKMKLKARQPVKAPHVLPSKVPKPSQNEFPDPGTSQKLVVSVQDKDKMDPLIPLCPYDIKGVCKDEECQYQHLKN